MKATLEFNLQDLTHIRRALETEIIETEESLKRRSCKKDAASTEQIMARAKIQTRLDELNKLHDYIWQELIKLKNTEELI